VSIGFRANYQVPLARPAAPAGIDGGVCPKPVSLSAGLRHRAQRTGVPMLFGGPNGTKEGTAFAALQVREASG
jgi:hypothetical protein